MGNGDPSSWQLICYLRHIFRSTISLNSSFSFSTVVAVIFAVSAVVSVVVIVVVFIILVMIVSVGD